MKLNFVTLLGISLLAFCPATLKAQNTLSNGLDSTLVWTSGGTLADGWVYVASSGFSDNSFDGIDAAETGIAEDGGESWLQTTVVGPGKISFWWNAYSEANADILSFWIGDEMMAQVSGTEEGLPSGWIYQSFEIAPGTNVLSWRYSKDFAFTGGTGDVGWLDKVRFVTSEPPLKAALGTCGVEWTSGGNTNETFWFAQTQTSRDGLAAQAGDTSHGQTNWLQATVTGITNLSYWWKVSSETNNDMLEFYTNGVFAKRISGEVNWQSNYFRFAANKTNTIKWVYRRDSSITGGQNTAWLDEIRLSPTPPANVRYETTAAQRLQDGRFQFLVNGDDVGCPCLVQFTTNMVNWLTLTNFTTTGASSTVVDPAAAGSPMRFYRAVSP